MKKNETSSADSGLRFADIALGAIQFNAVIAFSRAASAADERERAQSNEGVNAIKINCKS